MDELFVSLDRCFLVYWCNPTYSGVCEFYGIWNFVLHHFNCAYVAVRSVNTLAVLIYCSFKSTFSKNTVFLYCRTQICRQIQKKWNFFNVKPINNCSSWIYLSALLFLVQYCCFYFFCFRTNPQWLPSDLARGRYVLFIVRGQCDYTHYLAKVMGLILSGIKLLINWRGNI